jgi:L-asparaginase
MALSSTRQSPPALAGSSRPASRRGATPEQRAAFERAAKSGVVIVQCSRAASGRVAPRRRLRETGIVAGEDLSPQKARILLMLALSTTTEIPAIQEAFSAH